MNFLLTHVTVSYIDACRADSESPITTMTFTCKHRHMPEVYMRVLRHNVIHKKLCYAYGVNVIVNAQTSKIEVRGFEQRDYGSSRWSGSCG